MDEMKRLYEAIVREHLEKYELMVFICGPRQVGKTTLAQSLAGAKNKCLYVNWDNLDDRQRILEGPSKLLEGDLLSRVSKRKPLLILDEIHKYEEWSSFVKGIYDRYKDELKIIVTGSARLNVYRRGGDSMMGRYFQYRMHPLSVGELLHTQPSKTTLRKPKRLSVQKLNELLEFGGFPKPFLSKDKAFASRWQSLRHQQLINQDLRDISDVRMTSRIEVLTQLLSSQSGQLFNYSNTATKIRVSNFTVRHWMDILEELYYCFKIHPWSTNVERSLLKNPKYYLWDWSRIKDMGARVENFVASHLLKAVHYWNDTGQGEYGLYFIRDKDQNEVDFLVVENGEPWMLIEVKSSEDRPLSKSLKKFQEQLKPKYSVQLAYDMSYVDFDVRDIKKAKIMPMSTFLSQLP